MQLRMGQGGVEDSQLLGRCCMKYLLAEMSCPANHHKCALGQYTALKALICLTLF